MSFVRPVCQALSGKKVRSEEVCNALSGKSNPADEELMEPIMTGEGIVTLSGSKKIVDAEHANGSAHNGVEVPATPPIEFTVKLGQQYQEGQTIKVNGPHGPIEIPPPAESEPGASLVFRLAPEPEFRIQVPPDVGPKNRHVKLRRPDGVQIAVPIPEGLEPGDNFEVTPPALMVKVPQGIEAGTKVVFKDLVGNWFRCQVPEGVNADHYFAARLPQPKPQRK